MLRLADRYKDLMDAGELHTLCNTVPWSHFVLDGLVVEDQFGPARDRVLKSAGEFDIDSDAVQVQMQFLNDVEMAEFFFSDDVRRLLEGLAGSAVTPNLELAIQLRRMTAESPAFPPHVDRVERRSIACLYYLSDDWCPGRGGEVVLLPQETTSFSSRDTNWIAPIANRLLVFYTEDSHWHAVNRVVNWTRHLIVTEWVVV